MKKILLLLLTFLSIVVIYILNIDDKVYFFAIGDEMAIGNLISNKNQYSHNFYIKEYLEKEKKLENYIDSYQKQGLRINDVINDINSNKKIEYNGKLYSIKNILIKSDLVTISINNESLLNKILNYSDIQELYTWSDELVIEYEKMLELIREYCKEKVMVIGYSYPNVSVNNEEVIRFINYLNDEFLEVSQIYNVDYINISKLLSPMNGLMENNYPTQLGYEMIGKETINIIMRSGILKL